MKNFKINGISVTDHEGVGIPLLFIHAFPLCSRMWDEQVSYFKDKYRVITYDIRGLGYSNELEDYQYSMEELVNDLFRILDEMKLEKVIACGLSVGGYILLRALVRDQSRFTKVILADTKSENDDNSGLISRSEMIIRLKAGEREKVSEELIKKLLSENGYKDEKVRKFVEMMISWMDVKGLCSVILAMATRTNTFYQLKNIETPALIIVGKEDALTPPVRSFYLREYLKNAVMKVIPEAGHLSNLEFPAEFNKAVEEFL
ncbi:MAG TPA: alpha/beta hydrolase [Ignavibacteria bacterium]|nr:alpha/beta hydrolase [Ignavibacteria bacterium]